MSAVVGLISRPGPIFSSGDALLGPLSDGEDGDGAFQLAGCWRAPLVEVDEPQLLSTPEGGVAFPRNVRQ